MTGAPDPNAPARRFGAPRQANVPKVEDVRVTAPDLERRALLDATRGRLVMAAGGFALLFLATTSWLAVVTVIAPHTPKLAMLDRPVRPPEPPATPPVIAPAAAPPIEAPRARRAMITDRNGEVLALSLPTASVIADPRLTLGPDDAADAAHKLKQVLPDLDEAATKARLLEPRKQFVYIARQITPRQELAINALGIPGIGFEPTERRRYPLGRMAAQVLGGVNVDGHGSAGIEKQFDDRLLSDAAPLRLSIDVRAEAVVRDELSKAMAEFKAIGAAGIILDVRTGEVIAMVSLPDFDINEPRGATDDQRFNRTVSGVYEPGSTFKLQTVSMALDSGTVHIWNGFDATNPIRIGRFSINDFEGKHRWLAVPEIIAYSSNIGAARMAEATGTALQRAWMQKMGMMSHTGVDLPEGARTLFPPVANWKEAATLTMGFGHGIAVTPLHVVVATAAVANGGVKLRPTLLAQDSADLRPQGPRVMQQSTSDTVRKLMRLVVTQGYGKAADVPGYFVGGKTGTAEKSTKNGYAKKDNVSAFMSVFPMNAPRYAVYIMLDTPRANAETHGYATAGWVSAPAAGRVIARVAPMLGLLPETDTAAATEASLAIPLQPGRPAGAPATPVAHAEPPPAVVTQPATLLARDLRRSASLRVPANAGQ